MHRANDEKLRQKLLRHKELMSKEKDERVRKGLVGFWIVFSVFVTACIITGGVYVFVKKGAAEMAAIAAIAITCVIWIMLSIDFVIMMLKAKNIPDIPLQSV